MTQPYTLHITLPGLPPISSNGAQGQWRAVHGMRQQWKRLVRLAIGHRTPKAPLRCAQITLTRHSATEPDYDGLVVSFKPIVDGLVEAGVMQDDGMSYLPNPKYAHKYAKQKEGFIEVELTEIELPVGKELK